MTATWKRRPGPLAILASYLALGAGADQAAGQILQGRVVDEHDERPIAAALVQLVDREGHRMSAAVADSAGRYRLEAPEPGEYHVVAEALGYETVRSLLFELASPGGTYAVDVGLRPAPIPVRGITVTAERRDLLERSIRTAIGMSPASLRTRPFMRSELAPHVARGHGLEDFMRWSNVAGLTVRQTVNGPCFDLGGRTTRSGSRACVPVYLNEWGIPPWVVDGLELDLVDAVVVVHRLESLEYPNGAVLLYTSGWLR